MARARVRTGARDNRRQGQSQGQGHVQSRAWWEQHENEAPG
ncbi:unnamed protein product [Ectocarpus sp. 12 AP-2014]